MVPPGITECESCRKTWYASRCYIQCFECGHVYRTRWHLWLAYWREVLTYRRIFPKEYSLLRVFRGTWRPGLVNFCQCCLHDF
jgi:hypothetical protein